jgi:AcrR family transcriptional regulator
MEVSRQQSTVSDDAERGNGQAIERGPRARTKRLMLETATRLMQAGATPSVSEVAEAAEVSRATAYRYFPSQAALVQAVVDEGLGPILTWQSTTVDAERRVAELFDTAMPRIEAFEATFKAALKLSLDQWARRQAGTLGGEPTFTRGHRIDLLKEAIAPLKGRLPPRDFKRLAQALSLIFGVEVLVVLKDMWGLGSAETLSVTQWAAAAMVRAAMEETMPGAATPVPSATGK